ncbi:nucleotidyltransferase domain-containing protein [Candidatus Saganbacteria bacterium CG08_land_8_20_14_0_20_45_16]|uniref:Nucleotidyltransferase domain-containing protein n=1 Tax=Candidatus Saganbacteria bacterium CG08_land_8_20_14_0_20_45_16 TaxID=2014293 RepID=A0A2H0XU45_UNCSA|nr:MAG: nucleotidyltransferase domain-containing protein [Candidatus Saganbacteria bacterium CG08_land_8_20_14_0_20_45_16]
MTCEKQKKPIKPPVTASVLADITQRIVEKVKPEKIILFGSYAYGKPGKDSDLDLFIVKKTKLRSKKRYGLVSDALFPRLIPMDFVIRTPGEIKSRLKNFDPFLQDIISNGKVLYEKG